MSDEANFNHLVGRIVALEEIARALLTLMIMEYRDPVATVDGLKKSFFGNLQHLPREFTPQADAAWEETVVALEKTFAEVRARVVRESSGA